MIYFCFGINKTYKTLDKGFLGVISKVRAKIQNKGVTMKALVYTHIFFIELILCFYVA